MCACPQIAGTDISFEPCDVGAGAKFRPSVKRAAGSQGWDVWHIPIQTIKMRIKINK